MRKIELISAILFTFSAQLATARYKELLSALLRIIDFIFFIISIILQNWIVSNVAGRQNIGLIQTCTSVLESEYCYHHREGIWFITFLLIAVGTLVMDVGIVFIIVTHFKRITGMPRIGVWGLCSLLLYSIGTLLFPLGFGMPAIGGQPFKLPTSHETGISFLLFITGFWLNAIGEIISLQTILPSGW